MWNNNSKARRRDVLHWAKISRTRGVGALMVVVTVVTIASSATSSSSSSSTTTTAASTTSTRPSSNHHHQGGFLLRSPLHFWKRTTSNDSAATSSQNRGVPPSVIPNKYNQRERSPVSALSMAPGRNAPLLQWFRLDDGVMGGQSTSAAVADQHTDSSDNGVVSLHFTGTINTNSGGFASIRAALPTGTFTPETTGIKICYRGDGKTYKVLLSDGTRGGGGRQNVSWQANLPTQKSTGDKHKDDESSSWQEMILPFTSFIPNVGVGRNRKSGSDLEGHYVLDPVETKQIGLMLSLLLADGQPNPKSTFGSGIFDFSLQVKSIEPVIMD